MRQGGEERSPGSASHTSIQLLRETHAPRWVDGKTSSRRAPSQPGSASLDTVTPSGLQLCPQEMYNAPYWLKRQTVGSSPFHHLLAIWLGLSFLSHL